MISKVFCRAWRGGEEIRRNEMLPVVRPQTCIVRCMCQSNLEGRRDFEGEGRILETKTPIRTINGVGRPAKAERRLGCFAPVRNQLVFDLFWWRDVWKPTTGKFVGWQTGSKVGGNADGAKGMQSDQRCAILVTVQRDCGID